MIKNKKAVEMRRLCNECKKNHNRGFGCEQFHLTKEMNHHPSKWEMVGVGEQRIKGDKVMAIFLPEFMNRHSFVSSFAWLMNSFSRIEGVTRHHAVELLCVALLTPSQIQFQRVVRHLKNEFKPRNNLCYEYLQHCNKHSLHANGGPRPRFMVGKATELPCGITEINANLELIEKAIDHLNEGGMMNSSGVFVDNKAVVDVKGIGAARAISFPSLCCFTGLGTTWQAIQTAKQAILNSVTGNGCVGDKPNELSKLGQKLRVHGDSPPHDNSHCHSILEAAGKSVGEVQSTMENAACAITRTQKKEDMFVKGQSLHCLFLDSESLQACGAVEQDDSQVESTVYEKKFGKNKWLKAVLPKWQPDTSKVRNRHNIGRKKNDHH